MPAICLRNGIDRHEGRLARLNRTAGRSFEKALRGSDRQPRLTRILTAPKSPVVGSAIHSRRLPRVHGECHRLDAGKHRPWTATRIQIESIEPAGKSNEQSGHRVPLPVDRAFNQSLRCSSLLPSFVGQSSAFTNRRCFGDGSGSTPKIRVSSPSVRKVMGSLSCSRNEAGGTALRSSETPLSSLKHRKPNNISNDKTLISEATAASEMPNLLHRRVPAPVLLT